MGFLNRLMRHILFFLVILGSQALNAQTDTIRYLFMGHPRSDDRDHEYVLETVEKLDYSEFNLLLLGGDLTWNTSQEFSTLEYCDLIFHLGNENTHLAMGNHDADNIPRLLSYTKKDRYYAFNKNNLTFIVLDTELSTPDISGSQLELIKTVADTIKSSDYLILLLHRILWMADNEDLAYLMDSVAASTKSLSSSNFFEDVYPELQKVKNKGIPVYCIAGDRTNLNIEYSKEDSIQFIASGMVGTYPDSSNFTVVLTHIPGEHLLKYDFVALNKMDTLDGSAAETARPIEQTGTDYTLFPNPCSNVLSIRLHNKGHETIKTELFSLQGTRLLENYIPKETYTLTMDVSFLPEGMYFIRISNPQQSLTEKICITAR
jgi:hypothetical protein